MANAVTKSEASFYLPRLAKLREFFVLNSPDGFSLPSYEQVKAELQKDYATFIADDFKPYWNYDIDKLNQTLDMLDIIWRYSACKCYHAHDVCFHVSFLQYLECPHSCIPELTDILDNTISELFKLKVSCDTAA